MCNKKSGFTIIEALIVLTIIAAILGMSIPQLSRFTRHSSINSAAPQILNILRTARSFAISRNSNYAVNFDNTIIPNVVWITDPTNNIIGKRYNLPKTVRISNITFLNDRVTFKPTGGISGNNGSVTITDTAGVTKQIAVINTTGRVKIN